MRITIIQAQQEFLFGSLPNGSLFKLINGNGTYIKNNSNTPDIELRISMYQGIATCLENGYLNKFPIDTKIFKIIDAELKGKVSSES